MNNLDSDSREEELVGMMLRSKPAKRKEILTVLIDRLWTSQPDQLTDRADELSLLRTTAENISQDEKNDLLRINALGLRHKKDTFPDLAWPQLGRVRYLIALGADADKPLIPADIQNHLENIGVFISQPAGAPENAVSVRQLARMLTFNGRIRFDLADEIVYARDLTKEIFGSGYAQIVSTLGTSPSQTITTPAPTPS
jgi:hypothetical protein